MLIFGYIYTDSAPPDNYNISEDNFSTLLRTKKTYKTKHLPRTESKIPSLATHAPWLVTEG